MKVYPRTAVALSFVLVFLPACYSYQIQQAREEIMKRQREILLNTEAWLAARRRLLKMCTRPPETVKAYLKHHDVSALHDYFSARDRLTNQAKQSGKSLEELFQENPSILRTVALEEAKEDLLQGCNARFVKLSNKPRLDDWDWDWLPSYQTVVEVHDQELRKRVVPKLYEEYVLGLSRYLAEKSDNELITPEQLMTAFNEGWKWLAERMREEAELLLASAEAARRDDAAFWNTLGTLAAGLAVVAGAALVAAASAPRYPAPAVVPTVVSPTLTYQPVNCVARPAGGVIGAGGRTYYTSVRVNCY